MGNSSNKIKADNTIPFAQLSKIKGIPSSFANYNPKYNLRKAMKYGYWCRSKISLGIIKTKPTRPKKFYPCFARSCRSLVLNSEENLSMKTKVNFLSLFKNLRKLELDIKINKKNVKQASVYYWIRIITKM